MALKIRHIDDSGRKLGFAVERLSDGRYFDFAANAFVATAPPAMSHAAFVAPLAEKPAPEFGLYEMVKPDTPPGTWPDGDYVAYLHDLAELAAGSRSLLPGFPLWVVMKDGDDGSYFAPPYPTVLSGVLTVAPAPTPTPTPAPKS